MFEITGEDIAQLNDGDLRSLVALLCEAELRSRGLATAAVTAGGNQDAPDGGIDVRVALSPESAIDGFVPRRDTGFQVKVPEMPRGEILREMKPSGVIRPAVKELADRSGAYIIVSSTASTSDSALNDRRAAMAEAISSLPNAASLALDFYDRDRLATWVRNHPGLIPWVRQRIGRALEGWQSYGAWAYDPKGVAGEYLVDESVRIRTGEKDDGDGLRPLAGIERIRNILRWPGRVVRLVGLSGVGKTRLAQALFDERVGESALASDAAIYTNLSDGPNPQPIGLASDLIAANSRAVLIVDNCPPDLHRRLSELCRAAGSRLSVLTIEYDIRDDQQEGTEVFKLEPSSKELMQKLIGQRFTAVSLVDAGTIAEFSGGNARVAMALAGTVKKGDTITGLKDEDLFRRLFHQNQQPDENLLRIAQACALLYSFQGEALEGAEAELPRLGALIGTSAEKVYAAVAELKQRDLAQQRNVWRAILPHAIANRLAALALQNIPLANIEKQLIEDAPVRVQVSFSRRLGLLGNSKEAQAIAQRWLAPDGLLGDVGKLSEVKATMLKNVAPVVPDATLTALERAKLRALSKGTRFVRLLRSLAYDPQLFERAALLLAKLSEGCDADEAEAVSDAFTSLFTIYLSGTRASIEQRLKVIEALAASASKKEQALGVAALKKVLDTGPFTSSYDFEFGARSRDHGYRPRTQADIDHWYGSALATAERLRAAADLSAEVEGLVASRFRGLWRAGMSDVLDRLMRKMTEGRFWRDGWIAVRQTQQYHAKDMKPDLAQKLAALEKSLRPQGTLDKVRSIVLSGKVGRLDLDEWDDTEESISVSLQKRVALVHELGETTAKDEAAFGEILPELFNNRGQVFDFGRGLAKGTDEPKKLWKKMVAEFGKAGANVNTQVLRGFLNGLHQHEPKIAQELLDGAVVVEALKSVFPELQTAVPIDSAGVARIKKCLKGGGAPAESFRPLAWGRASDPIPAVELRDILVDLAGANEGLNVACEILYMRLHTDREKGSIAEELRQTGRFLLSKLKFTDKHDREDHQLGDIAKVCLQGAEGAETARSVCEKLRLAAAKNETSASYQDDLLKGMLSAQPLACLDGLFGRNAEEQAQGLEVLRDIRFLENNPIDGVADQTLLQWCDGAPETRYPLAGSMVSFSQQKGENSEAEWSPTALALLAKAPDRIAYLRAVIGQFRPMSWSGSRSAIMESNAKLLTKLDAYSDPKVVEFARSEKARLDEEAQRERKYETVRDKDQDERFE